MRGCRKNSPESVFCDIIKNKMWMAVEKREKLEYKIFTRIGKNKYDELVALLHNSNSKTISSLLRNILHHKKIVVFTRDVTMDNIMEQLSGIRKELLVIGVNVNQATRKLNQSQFNQEQLFLANEILHGFQKASLKVEALFEIINNLSVKWLPK